jgi:hypothetical protein
VGNALTRSVTRLFLIIAFAAAGGLACPAESGPTSVERYRVTVTVGLDGRLDVSEQITTRPAPGEAAIERRISPGRFDAILDARATMDGQPVGGDSGGRLPSARWTFRADVERPHELSLGYKVDGALQLEGRQRRLTWRAFEATRAYAIEHAIVELQTPPGVAILMPSGMAEAGWQVSLEGSRLIATRDRLPAAAPGTLLALLGGDALPLREPTWQFDLARVGQLAPAFAAGGAFILVVAVGIVLMLWRFDRRHPSPGRRRQLRVSALVVFLSGVGCAVAAWLLLQPFGWWPHAIGLGLAASALLFYVLSFRYPRAPSPEPRA